jgi:hypothetical protein
MGAPHDWKPSTSAFEVRNRLPLHRLIRSKKKLTFCFLNEYVIDRLPHIHMKGYILNEQTGNLQAVVEE